MDRLRRHGWVLGAYLVCFGLLFAPLAWHGLLPGNCDTWLNGIAIPHLIGNELTALLSGQAFAGPLHPTASPLAFGESAPLLSLGFVALAGLCGDDVTAYYLFITMIFATSATGLYLLATVWVRDRIARFSAGLFFGCSSFALGHIDSPHAAFYGLFFVSLACAARYLWQQRGVRWAYAAGVTAGLQAYCSAYLFAFLCVALVVLVAASPGVGRALRRPSSWAAAALTVALAAPFFAFYGRALASPDLYDPWIKPIMIAEAHSLDPSDLFRPLPNNLVYPGPDLVRARDLGLLDRQLQASGLGHPREAGAPLGEDLETALGRPSELSDPKLFAHLRRCALLGFGLYGLALLALGSRRRGRWLLLGLFGAGLAIALGPTIAVGDQLWPAPAYPVYRWLDAAGRLRVPSRAFCLSVLAVAILAAQAIASIRRALSAHRLWQSIATVGLVAIVLVENVPVPLAGFAGDRLARAPAELTRYLRTAPRRPVLKLPSEIGAGFAGDSWDLFAWNREAIYMSWQSQHRQPTVNGINGYLPRRRVALQKLIDRLPDDAALDGLIGEHGVGYVAYFPRLRLAWESDLDPWLGGSRRLRRVASGARFTLYEVEPSADPLKGREPPDDVAGGGQGDAGAVD